MSTLSGSGVRGVENTGGTDGAINTIGRKQKVLNIVQEQQVVIYLFK